MHEPVVALGASRRATVMTASVVAAPALRRTVVLSRSTNRTRREPTRRARSAGCGHPAARRRARRPASSSAARRLVGAHADAQRAPSAPSATSSRSASKASRSVRVVADVERRVEVASVEQRAHAAALVELDRRADLEHLAPPVGDEAGRPRRARRSSRTAASAASSSGAPRQWKAPMTSLSSARTRRRWSSLRPRLGRRTRARAAPAPATSWSSSTSVAAAAQELGAVVADVGDRAERDDPPRGRRPGGR